MIESEHFDISGRRYIGINGPGEVSRLRIRHSPHVRCLVLATSSNDHEPRTLPAPGGNDATGIKYDDGIHSVRVTSKRSTKITYASHVGGEARRCVRRHVSTSPGIGFPTSSAGSSHTNLVFT